MFLNNLYEKISLHPCRFTGFVLAVRTDFILKGVTNVYTQNLQDWPT